MPWHRCDSLNSWPRPSGRRVKGPAAPESGQLRQIDCDCRRQSQLCKERFDRREPGARRGPDDEVMAVRSKGRARGRSNGFCDDEAVLLICPTCQVSAQSIGSGDRLLLCMGLFSIFLAEPRRPGATVRHPAQRCICWRGLCCNKMARRKRFELAIMLNIISLSFNIPRDGGEVERHRACPQHPRLATALHLQECVDFTDAEDRLLQISEADHFRTRLPQ